VSEKYGLPLANANNIMSIVKSSGIGRWQLITDAIAMEDYPDIELTKQEMKIKRRLQIKVSRFLSPSGEHFRGFRWVGGSGTRVFTIIDGDLIPICAEYQHGCREVIFDLPGGKVETDEELSVCAKREFEEESGIVLDRVIPLSSVGMPIAARHRDARNYSFIGVASNPVTVKLQKLDAHEHLKVFLISLDDWLKLIDREMVQSYSASTTLLALRWLGS
jgi:ADP-ribose pyrophosphatase YjhB (NUDIX family)